MSSFTIAAVQASPIFLDRDRTIDKACDLIADAGRAGAQLAVFPEAFVPAYPVWSWFVPAARTHELRALYAELHANAIAIPDAATERLAKAARGSGVAVAIGVNERNREASDSTLYNTLLYIGADGAIVGRHRKLVPTGGERLIWGYGDGSDLEVLSLPFARVGGLICWENYMPLARYALAAWGAQIHLAPTWDRGEPWISTLRHIAKESRCFVVGCSQAVRRNDIPDRLPFKSRYMADAGEWINAGDSAIVDPDGKIVAGPAREVETTLYAEVRTEQLVGPRWQLDIAGHYARPDVFELRVHRAATPMIRVGEAQSGKIRKGRSGRKGRKGA